MTHRLQEISSLASALSLFLTACQGAKDRQVTVGLDQQDRLLLDCGVGFLDDALGILLFLAGREAMAPEPEQVVACDAVLRMFLEKAGAKARGVAAMQAQVRAVRDTLQDVTTQGIEGVSASSIALARQFFFDLEKSIPEEAVEERARLIVHVPDNVVNGLRRVAQQQGTTMNRLVLEMLAAYLSS